MLFKSLISLSNESTSSSSSSSSIIYNEKLNLLNFDINQNSRTIVYKQSTTTFFTRPLFL